MAMAMTTGTSQRAMAVISLGNTVPSSRTSLSGPKSLYRIGTLRPQWRVRHCSLSAQIRGGFTSGSGRRATLVARAAIEEKEQTSAFGVKEFLEDLKPLGRVRLIVNTGVGVLESVIPNLDKLFYHTLPGRGEYANLMLQEENVDFHLLIDKLVSAKLETGKSMRGAIPTYMIRFVDNNEAVAVSLLVMWKPGSNGDFDDGQVEAYQNLEKKYGSALTFAPNASQ